MARQRRSDEEIIAAILEAGSIRQAAASLGIQERTIYTRAKNKEFKLLYLKARRDLLEDAAASLQAKTGEAIRVIYDLMKDEKVAAQTRLSCAESILRHAEKIADVSNLEAKINALEDEGTIWEL